MSIKKRIQLYKEIFGFLFLLTIEICFLILLFQGAQNFMLIIAIVIIAILIYYAVRS